MHTYHYINELFSYEKLFALSEHCVPWYANIFNYISIHILSFNKTYNEKKKFIHDAKFNFWGEPYMLKKFKDQIIRGCVTIKEVESII